MHNWTPQPISDDLICGLLFAEFGNLPQDDVALLLLPVQVIIAINTRLQLLREVCTLLCQAGPVCSLDQ